MIAKFYKQVDVAQSGEGFAVHLDGKPLKTPARATLILPTAALANEIADEWDGQDENIDPETMPLTKLANTAIDGVITHRADIAAAILNFGRNDLLCYRAEAPEDLARRQAAAWNPQLLWLAARHGTKLEVTTGINAIPQSEAAMESLSRALDAHGDFALTALHVLAGITGSLVLALALAEERMDGETAFALSRIDEDYQAEKWGVDGEAAKRADTLRRELEKALEFLTLSQIPSRA